MCKTIVIFKIKNQLKFVSLFVLSEAKVNIKIFENIGCIMKKDQDGT